VTKEKITLCQSVKRSGAAIRIYVRQLIIGPVNNTGTKNHKLVDLRRCKV